MVVGTPSLENAPTCYRAPKWPDPEFPEKIPKKYLPGRNSGLPEFSPKIPRKYQKIPKKYPKVRILVFFRYFWGIFLGFQNFGPGGIFRGNSGAGHSGLCSRSGRSQPFAQYWCIDFGLLNITGRNFDSKGSSEALSSLSGGWGGFRT